VTRKEEMNATFHLFSDENTSRGFRMVELTISEQPITFPLPRRRVVAESPYYYQRRHIKVNTIVSTRRMNFEFFLAMSHNLPMINPPTSPETGVKRDISRW